MNNTKINSVISYLVIIAFIFISITLNAQKEKGFDAAEITDAIEFDLLVDDFVSSHLIDVSTISGIVTLKGSVDNLLAKERAKIIAESIKGVRSVVNEIKVKPAPVSDSELESNIKLALFLDPVVSLYPLDLKVNNGVITLSGTTGSWTEKQLAANVVKNVKGVKDINNNITILYEEDYTDLEIKNAIQKQYSYNPYIDEAFITVKVENGNATLSGTVGSAAEKSMLFNSTWVAGVNSVNDENIEIEFWAKDNMKRESKIAVVTDKKIRDALISALVFDPRVNLLDINVQVNNGYVTLEGKVKNLKAKNSAHADARNTLGVIGVENRIKVRPDPSDKFTDEEIQENIKKAFELDPLLNMQELRVRVLNKKAYLYGLVETYGEKYHAANVASIIKGVIDLTNYINVNDEMVYKSDQMIKDDIESELFWSFYVDSDDINVTVEKGVATLTGEVSNTAELNSTIENAFEGGANIIVSKLDIEDQSFYNYRTYHRKYPVFIY